MLQFLSVSKKAFVLWLVRALIRLLAFYYNMQVFDRHIKHQKVINNFRGSLLNHLQGLYWSQRPLLKTVPLHFHFFVDLQQM